MTDIVTFWAPCDRGTVQRDVLMVAWMDDPALAGS